MDAMSVRVTEELFFTSEVSAESGPILTCPPGLPRDERLQENAA